MAFQGTDLGMMHFEFREEHAVSLQEAVVACLASVSALKANQAGTGASENEAHAAAIMALEAQEATLRDRTRGKVVPVRNEVENQSAM